MKKRLFIILGVVLAAVAVWVYLSAAEVVQAERDVEARFNDVVTFYTGLNSKFVVPLIQTSTVSDTEKIAIQKISDDLKQLEKTTSLDSRYDGLLRVQQEIFGFFTTPGLSEVLLAEELYRSWNVDATSQGQGSLVILNYNRALSRYNDKLSTPIGKIMGNWPKWTHPEYLTLDGKTQPSTLVQF